MVDAMDWVQQRELEERDRSIQNARSQKPAASFLLCEGCDAPIPQARRLAVPGVECCVTCQEIKERKSKHYISGFCG